MALSDCSIISVGRPVIVQLVNHGWTGAEVRSHVHRQGTARVTCTACKPRVMPHKRGELYLRNQTEMASYVTCCKAKPDDAGTKMRFVLSLKVPRTKVEDKTKTSRSSRWLMPDSVARRHSASTSPATDRGPSPTSTPSRTTTRSPPRRPSRPSWNVAWSALTRSWRTKTVCKMRC